MNYEVGPKTSLHAGVYARSQNSPSLAGQFFQSNGFTAGIDQKLGTKVNVGVDLGYDFSEYRSYQGGVISSRRDRVIFVRPWAKYTLSRRISLELFYQHTRNSSSGLASQSFERDLLGAGITGSW